MTNDPIDLNNNNNNENENGETNNLNDNGNQLETQSTNVDHNGNIEANELVNSTTTEREMDSTIQSTIINIEQEPISDPNLSPPANGLIVEDDGTSQQLSQPPIGETVVVASDESHIPDDTTSSVDIVTKTVQDGKFFPPKLIPLNKSYLLSPHNLKDDRKLAPVPKDIYGSRPSSRSPTPSDGKVQKLKNVSIQELKKDLEKSRQLQRQKMRKGDGGAISPVPTVSPTPSERKPKVGGSTKVSGARKGPKSTLQVEQLDISAPLDVSSVGSPSPSPIDETIEKVSGEIVPKPKPAGKGRGKPKKSMAGVKLTELEMAKLGRLAHPDGPKGRGAGRTTMGPGPPGGKLSPRPSISPKPPSKSPKLTKKTSAVDSPIPGDTTPTNEIGGEEGEDPTKRIVRVPRKEVPTRREKFQEKQKAIQKAKKGEDGETTIDKVDGIGDDKRASSSERSGSRERNSLNREMSKDKGKSGSRKQSLLDGSSPASRATKNINDYGYKLVALCRKGDWVGVDTIIKYIVKYNVEFDKEAASETTGWSPLMFAVRDNRIQIVERLIDLGFSVNTRAKVRFISFE